MYFYLMTKYVWSPFPEPTCASEDSPGELEGDEGVRKVTRLLPAVTPQLQWYFDSKEVTQESNLLPLTHSHVIRLVAQQLIFV